MQVYLAAAPDCLRDAARYPPCPVRVAYRIGPTGHLTGQPLPPGLRGGLLSLSDQESGAVSYPEALCREVLEECTRRGYGGVLADFERPVSPDRSAFLTQLSRSLGPLGRPLFVPEPYGQQLPSAQVLLCTALSGGTLRRRLEEGRRRFGRRLALDLQRLRMDFPLPCPTGEGRPLSQQELSALLERHHPTVFFSSDLGAKYFSYLREGRTRLVLFDDADTLRRKLSMGRSLGIAAAFLMYPETADLLPQLFPAARV